MSIGGGYEEWGLAEIGGDGRRELLQCGWHPRPGDKQRVFVTAVFWRWGGERGGEGSEEGL